MHNRVFYLDLLKNIALIAVVIIHIAMPFWYKLPAESVDWQIMNCIAGALRWCVPIFFMISGALFLSPQKHLSIETVIKKYIPRIIISYLAWAFIYAFAKFFTHKITSIEDFLKAIMFGNYHMWFMFAISILYIVIPLLRKIAEDKKSTIYFIFLSLIFSNKVIIDSISFWQNNTEFFMSNLSIESIVGYFGYAMLGYYLSSNDISIKFQRVLYVTAFFSYVFLVVFTNVLVVSIQLKTENLFYYTSLANVFISASIFIYFKYAVSSMHFSEMTTKIVQTISSLSLGIYLAHDLMNGVLARVSVLNVLNPFLLITIKTILVFIGTVVIVLFLKKIPVVNKLCI